MVTEMMSNSGFKETGKENERVTVKGEDSNNNVRNVVTLKAILGNAEHQKRERERGKERKGKGWNSLNKSKN